MWKYNRITDFSSDCTATYEVILDKDYTVKEFVDGILNSKRDWGKFYIINGSHCEYNCGEFISKLNEDDLEKKIIKIKANGGWSNMDYFIETQNIK